jgi:hypothetical protein
MPAQAAFKQMGQKISAGSETAPRVARYFSSATIVLTLALTPPATSTSTM